MEYGAGIISRIYTWVWHPGNSEETLVDWTAFFILALIAAYLWSTVIKQVD